jgi:hypothetical protein
MPPVPVWPIATAVGWVLALAGLALGQPEAGDPEPVEAWAVVVGVGAFGAMCAAFVGLALRRRWAYAASLIAAGVLLAVVLASVRDDRSTGGWLLQAIPLVAVGVVSLLGWRRSAP